MNEYKITLQIQSYRSEGESEELMTECCSWLI